MSQSRGVREPLTEVRDRIRAHVVGRERELDLMLAAVAAGRDVLLEGPPGTSKSTLLRAITSEWGIPLVFVEGNADLTPARLIGHHNPARVLREDYSPDNFVDGPLVEAMRHGGFLYIEEFNRAPEDTLNTLLTAMAERRIAVPRVGEVVAAATFRVIASMNPYDNIGTTRLSTSVHDRLCRLAVSYQDAAAERGIVALRAPRFAQALADLKPATYERLVADAVAVTRATRAHEDIRQGSSVRGAIDLTLIAGQLFELDPERANSFHPAGRPGGPTGQGHEDEKSSLRVSPGPAADPGGRAAQEPDALAEQAYRDTIYDAMVLALSGRIFLDETVAATPEQVLRQIWEDHFILDPAAASPG
jgi:MoxR-like ATPase